MKSFIFFILGLGAGAAGGYFVTKYICDAKQQGKIEEATREAREFYKQKYEDDTKKVVNEEYHNIADTYTNPSTRIFGNQYTTYQSDRNIDYRSIPVEPNKNKPYLYMVDPDEAGMDDNYTQCSLDYYQDGNLVDEQGNLCEDPVGLVGDYLDDLSLENPEIYVRNDVTKTEYDICYIAAVYEQPGGEYD